MTQIELTHNLPDLLELAVDNADEVLTRKGYTYDYRDFHESTGGGWCSINLVGAVMAVNFDADKKKSLNPNDFNQHDANALGAIMRMGECLWRAAAIKLGATEEQAKTFTDLMGGDDLNGGLLFEYRHFYNREGFVKLSAEIEIALPRIRDAWNEAMNIGE